MSDEEIETTREKKTRKPGQCKDGYVRVCTEIKEDLNDLFKEYEDLTFNKVNKSKLMSEALNEHGNRIREEIKRIKAERGL